MEEEPLETVAETGGLRRRNSINTASVPLPIKLTKLSLPTSTSLPPLNGVSTSPKIDLELISLKSSTSYTSLRDLLPSSAVNSPTAAASAVAPASEISIRNRLVKQAAWAYLQPMSSSPCSSGPHHFLRRIWLRLSSRNPISACLRFINSNVVPCLTRLLDRILRILRVPVSR